MPTRHKLGTSSLFLAVRGPVLDPARTRSARLAHLSCMEPTTESLDTVLCLSELAARLGVTVQTIYDLRSQGRGPRGFRVGRELRFRGSEIDAWLARMEEADGARHPRADRS
ncbi:MAG: helix-turn-helix transcriptional regulator [Nocardioides sp.]